ncbi:type II toxin-antitoxin system HicA family toxin [bacterium]|nr:type II toxin-antitoxin system HicA family toxin [candidate division CSSED10-310 bacterium]
MKSASGKQFCRILEKMGWELKRVHGSHHIYMKSGCSIRISVPVHGNKTLKVGLLKHLMNAAGIHDDDL